MQEDQQRRGRGGMPRGTRLRYSSAKTSKYDPASGNSYRPGTNFSPEAAKKLLTMCQQTDLSVSAFLNALVENVQVDEDGAPLGWPNAAALKEAG